MDHNTKYNYCYYLYSFYKQIPYLFDQSAKHIWNLKHMSGHLAQNRHYSSPKSEAFIYLFFHVLHCSFTFLVFHNFRFHQRYFLNIFFSLRHGNNYFLSRKPSLFQFLGHSFILSGQPDALSFALELC